MVRRFAVALQLLTRIPVRLDDVTEADLRRSVMFFPAVGAVVAAVGIAVRAAAGPLLGEIPATVLAVAAMVVVTGAFHEDGLADTADAIWGGWTPQRRIEIMRDSRIGTYGACALLLSLALRIALLAPLDLQTFALVALCGHVLGRAAGVLLAALLPPVNDQGLGARVTGPAGAATTGVVALSAVAVSVAATGPWFAVPLALAVVAVLVLRRIARAALGGLTGDVLGAVNQAAHIAAMAGVVAVHRAELW
jgi:adenosylcobinamide-GDP ribazoletransferase